MRYSQPPSMAPIFPGSHTLSAVGSFKSCKGAKPSLFWKHSHLSNADGPRIPPPPALDGMGGMMDYDTSERPQISTKFQRATRVSFELEPHRPTLH